LRGEGYDPKAKKWHSIAKKDTFGLTDNILVSKWKIKVNQRPFEGKNNLLAVSIQNIPDHIACESIKYCGF